MNVAEIMTAKPVTIHQDGTLHDVLALMEAHHCRHVPVLNGEGQLVGMISDRDCRLALNSPYLVRETWQDDLLAHRLRARTIMTPAPVAIEPDAAAADAARLMLEYRVSALPVMRSETLIGIVTTSDILAAYITLTRRTAWTFHDAPRIPADPPPR
jgi:acetoin utilization protein AcuB